MSELDVGKVVAEARQRRAVRAASAEATRAEATEQRLKQLERDLGEIRQRINGLLWMVAGAGVGQVVLHFWR